MTLLISPNLMKAVGIPKWL